LATVVLAANAGPMTLDGTNTWLLQAPGESQTLVVDPGPDDEAHLAAVLAAVAAADGRVTTILLTHRHGDHSDGARRLHELTGAPVRALDPAQRLGGEGLGEGDVIAAGALALRVWATPGHSSDSLSFVLDGGGLAGGGSTPGPAVLTGDTILGRGTTVVAHPDGNLADYLTSLRRLRELGDATVLTGHGPELPRAGEVAAAYLAHRAQRLEQIRGALDELGPDATPRQIVELVYADVDRAVWSAAEMSVRAQLEYLRG
jgi:glyoxylase-like metal-dependent hydrolase (beta-lactamase superfamily II)